MVGKTVLVVESRAEIRARIADWLADAGFLDLECRGPCGPEFRCAGSRGDCGLIPAADVVLDLWQASDAALLGETGLRLMRRYVEAGKTVVGIEHGWEPPQLLLEDRLATIGWPPDRRDLVETVTALARRPEALR